MKLLLIAGIVVSASRAALADDNEVSQLKMSMAFLASPGSDAPACMHMRRQMAVYDRSAHMAEIAVDCMDDLKRAHAPKEAWAVPTSIALSSCETVNWSSNLCQGLKVLDGK